MTHEKVQIVLLDRTEEKWARKVAECGEHFELPTQSRNVILNLTEHEPDYLIEGYDFHCEVGNDGFDYEYGSESGIWNDENYNRVEGDLEVKFITNSRTFPSELFEFQVYVHSSDVDMKLESLSVEEVRLSHKTFGSVYGYQWTVSYTYRNA